MQYLNKTATAIFAQLLKNLGKQEYIRLESDGFMPLVIEKIERGVKTEYEAADLISISHFYIQNGDIIYDPEMIFLVVDMRDAMNSYLQLFIIPTTYRQDNMGLYEESVLIFDNKVNTVFIKPLAEHITFAQYWLLNIKSQGFLK